MELNNTKEKKTQYPGFGKGGSRAAQMLCCDFIFASGDRLCLMENPQLWEHRPIERKHLLPQLAFSDFPRKDLVWSDLSHKLSPKSMAVQGRRTR